MKFNWQDLHNKLNAFDLNKAPEDLCSDPEYLKYYGIDTLLNNYPVTHRHGKINCGHYTIACQFFEQKDAKINALIVHGYFEHGAVFKNIIELCLKRGYNVVVPDLPGHGLSSGRRLHINNFGEYSMCLFKLLEKFSSLKQPWHFIGQSTGGAALAEFLFQHPNKINVLSNVFLAPLLKIKKWNFNTALYQVIKFFTDEIPKKQKGNTHNLEYLEFKTHDPLQNYFVAGSWVGSLINWNKRFLRAKPLYIPALLIQGSKDNTVLWKYNLPKYASKFPDLELTIIPGAEHQLANEIEPWQTQLQNRLNLWLDKYDQ